MEPKFCANCGRPVDAGASFCAHCGHALHTGTVIEDAGDQPSSGPRPPAPATNVEPPPPVPATNVEPPPPVPDANVEPPPPVPATNVEPPPPSPWDGREEAGRHRRRRPNRSMLAVLGFVAVALALAAVAAVVWLRLGGSSGTAVCGPPASLAPAAGGSTPEPAPTSHVATDLEVMLPFAFSGVVLERGSISGANDDGLGEIAERLGTPPDSVTAAIAVETTGRLPVTLAVIRVEGVGGNVVLDAVVAEYGESMGQPSSVVLGGRSVTRFVAPDSRGTTYAYPTEDLLFFAVDESGTNAASIDYALCRFSQMARG